MSNTNAQLFASGDTTLPVYGFGARGYGIGATAVRGREAHVQFREQNSGFTPSEDYRAAKSLAGLWRDLDRNGCPYVMEGGIIMGLASVELSNGVRADFAHQLAPANAGIRQQLKYTDIDEGVAVDLDSYAASPTTLKANLSDITRVTPASAGYASNKTTAFIGGNAPIGYNITHELSSAWEDVFTNQKYSHQLTVKTHWNNMYAVNNGFMYGGVLKAATQYTVDQISAMATTAGLLNEAVVVTPAVSRAKIGFAAAGYKTSASVVTLLGMTVGAHLMPNPWLPGTLITVRDFAVLAANEDVTGTNSLAVKTIVAAELGIAIPADLTVGLAMIYGEQHKVGICFKRQSRAYSNNVSGTQVLSKQDIYASTYKYHVTVPGLGLSGAESEGIEADQSSASSFAKIRSGAAGNPETGVDVIFANLHIK